jgi:hypothetical protein
MDDRDLDLRRRAENELIRIIARRSPAPPVLAAAALETAARLCCSETEMRHLYAQLSVLDPMSVAWDESLASDLTEWLNTYRGTLSPRLEEDIQRAAVARTAPPLPGLSQLAARLFPVGLDAQRRLHHVAQAALASIADDPPPPGVPIETWNCAQEAREIIQELSE